MMIIGKRVSNFIIIPLHTYYIYYKKIAWKYRTQAPNTKYASLSAGGTGGTMERYKIQIIDEMMKWSLFFIKFWLPP